jgi:leader peptidase (prepilin peptidase)/N-methyltransferase
MSDALLTSVAAVATALLVGLCTRRVLGLLPEPAEPDGKIAYRDLGSLRFVVGCSLLAALAQALAATTLPRSVLPLWTVLATVGVLLAAIDGRTTWLPLSLTRSGWVLMAAAVGVSAVLGAGATDVARSALGAVVAGGLYLLVWVVSRGGFGFGDVRFAPMLGAATAAQSWTLLLWGLTLGTAVGAEHAGIRLLRRRPGGFPYAPSMLAGSYLAALALRLLVPR